MNFSGGRGLGVAKILPQGSSPPWAFSPRQRDEGFALCDKDDAWSWRNSWSPLRLSPARPARAQRYRPSRPIDIALEPDQAVEDRAHEASAALLSDFPKGYTLDATHRVHVE